jgi:hypothetical protein
MEQEEVRAEIERRRKRAKDLGLREKLWQLYYYGLSSYVEDLKKDPELILPELREGLEASKERIAFKLSTAQYIVTYEEGKREHSSWDSETTITPITITLVVDDRKVFRFTMKRQVTCGPDMPYFSESMGEVEGFIEGDWLSEISSLKDRIRAHRDEVRNRRRAPAIAKKLEVDIKNFGL